MTSANVWRVAIALTGLLLTTATAWAGGSTGVPVPEIGGSAIPAAMGLLAAGVLTLRARYRRK